MKCLECGAKLTITTGDHLYCVSDGIDVLLKGVKKTFCPECGDEGVGIPRIAQLNRVLVDAFAKQPTRLASGEIRFLRKYLGWSGADFASKFGVKPESVSRWENGKRTMSEPAERFLRYYALTHRPVSEYPLPEELIEAPQKQMQAKPLKNNWSLVA